MDQGLRNNGLKGGKLCHFVITVNRVEVSRMDCVVKCSRWPSKKKIQCSICTAVLVLLIFWGDKGQFSHAIQLQINVRKK